MAIVSNEGGCREILGFAEGMKEDKAIWVSFFKWLRGRILDCVKLIAGIFKAIHAQESKKTIWEKTKTAVEQLHSMKLKGTTLSRSFCLF